MPLPVVELLLFVASAILYLMHLIYTMGCSGWISLTLFGSLHVAPSPEFSAFSVGCASGCTCSFVVVIVVVVRLRLH